MTTLFLRRKKTNIIFLYFFNSYEYYDYFAYIKFFFYNLETFYFYIYIYTYHDKSLCFGHRHLCGTRYTEDRFLFHVVTSIFHGVTAFRKSGTHTHS